MASLSVSIGDAMREADLIVVGSGFFGATVAENAATAGFRVVVLEQRDHLGGNSYSYLDDETGIEVHKYGSHLFHTSNERVWNYVNRFDTFNDYRHVVWANHQGQLFPMPINLLTMSSFYGRHLTPAEARELISKESSSSSGSDSLEDKAISLIGRPLYEAFIRGYTKKQWQEDPKALPSSVISRLPVRYTLEHRYFADRWEGLPVRGYQNLIHSILSSARIACFTSTDFFDVRNLIPKETLIVYTGPVDRYFNYCEGLLGWRTLDFEFRVLNVEDFQGAAVVNYSDEEIPYTRIHEFKHLHPERETKKNTVVAYEYSRLAGTDDEPYYPINTAEDRDKLKKYRALERREEHVIFGGRLGTYQYLDMHMAIASALTTWENKVLPKLRTQN